MKRRNFFRKLSSILTIFVFVPNPVRSFLRLPQIQGNNQLQIISASDRIDTMIPIIEKWGHYFISVEDFAQAMHYGIYTNAEKQKSVLYVEKDRITFTADNSFVKVNDEMVQIPIESIFAEGEIWAQLEYFVKLVNNYSVLNMQYNPDQKVINIAQSGINIRTVLVSEKENGTLIQVVSSKQFTEKDIVLDIRNNYFHIDVYGGKIDPGRFAAISGAGIIGRVEGIQLGETASLVFKLKGNILARDLVFSQDTNDFYVNLRTKESLVSEESEPDRRKQELEKQRKRWMIDTIVIDAGHGGKDPGAIGYGKTREKDLVLPIALALGNIIEKNMPDVQVVYTRNKDVFIPLWKRTKIANDVDAKLFISIHCNSNKKSQPNGFETYFLSADKSEKATGVVMKENSAIEFEESQDQKRYEGLSFILATMLQSVNVKRSQFLASIVQNALKGKLAKLGMTSRGVKQGPFWVLVGATMPNVLVETGYISNKHEEKLLTTSTTQRKVAEGIFDGIKEYKEEIEKAS